MTRFLGRDVAYSGGGYFRFFPLWFVRRQIEIKDYSMCYFHINDLISEQGGIQTKEQYEQYFKEPGTFKNRYIRYLKTNVGRNSAWKKLKALISDTPFESINSADAAIDWGSVKNVNLSKG